MILKGRNNLEKINLLLAAVPLGFVLLVMLVAQVDFATVLSPAEKELLHFRANRCPPWSSGNLSPWALSKVRFPWS